MFFFSPFLRVRLRFPFGLFTVNPVVPNFPATHQVEISPGVQSFLSRSQRREREDQSSAGWRAVETKMERLLVLRTSRRAAFSVFVFSLRGPLGTIFLVVFSNPREQS